LLVFIIANHLQVNLTSLEPRASSIDHCPSTSCRLINATSLLLD